jgi:hypothetical protein
MVYLGCKGGATLLSYSEATNFLDRPKEICIHFETIAQKFYIGLGCDFSSVGESERDRYVLAPEKRPWSI